MKLEERIAIYDEEALMLEGLKLLLRRDLALEAGKSLVKQEGIELVIHD